MWSISVLEKSHLGAIKSTIVTFLHNRNEAPLWLFSFFSNQHHDDFSPKQNGKFIGPNVIMVLTFFFFEPYRGSRGLPLVFLDCFMYFLHFRISGVATYKPSLGPFFGSKEKKPLNPHISKSLLAPIWLFSRPLQIWRVLQFYAILQLHLRASQLQGDKREKDSHNYVVTLCGLQVHHYHHPQSADETSAFSEMWKRWWIGGFLSNGFFVTIAVFLSPWISFG